MGWTDGNVVAPTDVPNLEAYDPGLNHDTTAGPSVPD